MNMMRVKQLKVIALCLIFTLLVSPAMAADKKAVKVSAQEIALSGTLREREAAIVAKEKELATKEEELKALEKEIEAKIENLLVVQQELKGKLEDLKTEKDQRFRNLIKVYSTMSASKVAPLLNKMTDDEAVEILKAMKADLVAKIIPKLNQDKAVRVSKLLGMM